MLDSKDAKKLDLFLRISSESNKMNKYLYWHLKLFSS